MDEEAHIPADEGATGPAAKACVMCGGSAPAGNRRFVNRQLLCLDCAENVQAELENEHAGAGRIVPAVIGGVVGSLIGAGAWMGIAILTDYEVGFVAIAVGWLAGTGVVVGAGGKKGQPLQIVALFASILGIVLGKYFTVAHFVGEVIGGDTGFFDPEIFRMFTENIGEFFGLLDILFVFLAISVAWKVPAPTELSMSPAPRQPRPEEEPSDPTV